jgi:hypothetical protein
LDRASVIAAVSEVRAWPAAPRADIAARRAQRRALARAHRELYVRVMAR